MDEHCSKRPPAPLGLTFCCAVVSFQEISDKFTDHHELANKLLIKRLPAGVEQERRSPETIHQTETKNKRHGGQGLRC